jgi:hypothetical protein
VFASASQEAMAKDFPFLANKGAVVCGGTECATASTRVTGTRSYNTTAAGGALLPFFVGGGAGGVGGGETYCPCCPHEWLDYVLHGAAPYQQPSNIPTLRAIPLKVWEFAFSLAHVFTLNLDI